MSVNWKILQLVIKVNLLYGFDEKKAERLRQKIKLIMTKKKLENDPGIKIK